MAEHKLHGRPKGPMGHGPGMGPKGVGEKPKNFKGTLSKLVKYLSSYHVAIIIVALFTVGCTVFYVIGPIILGKATTEIFNGLISKINGGTGIDFTKIGKILLVLLALYACSTIFGYIQGFVMSGISQKMSFKLRKELSEKMNRLPMSYYDKRTYGEVLSRITNDVDTLGMSLNQSITQLISSVATLVGVLIMMITISPLMTIIAVLILPVSVALISLIVKRTQKFFKQQQEYLGHVN